MFLCSVLGWFGLAQLDGLVWLVSQNSGGEDEALHKPLLLQRSGLSTSLSCHSASWCNLLFLSFSHSAFRLCTRSHNSCTSSDRLAPSSLLSKRWCRHFYLELRHDVQQVGRLRLLVSRCCGSVDFCKVAPSLLVLAVVDLFLLHRLALQADPSRRAR